MLKTPEELRQDLGQAIRMRRIGQRLSQEESAKHAGMSLSTWKRMEVNGPSSVEHLINAAITLRCEEGLSQLFPPPAASSMDELLKRQTATADQKSPKRVRRRKVGS
jgi:transcriptional regulator with XRE-family HTH domain